MVLGKLVDKIISWKLERETNKFIKQAELDRKLEQHLCNHDFEYVGNYSKSDNDWMIPTYFTYHVAECIHCGKREESRDMKYIKTLIK